MKIIHEIVGWIAFLCIPLVSLMFWDSPNTIFESWKEHRDSGEPWGGFDGG